jgi:hypothetical protein
MCVTGGGVCVLEGDRARCCLTRCALRLHSSLPVVAPVPSPPFSLPPLPSPLLPFPCSRAEAGLDPNYLVVSVPPRVAFRNALASWREAREQSFAIRRAGNLLRAFGMGPLPPRFLPAVFVVA